MPSDLVESDLVETCSKLVDGIRFVNVFKARCTPTCDHCFGHYGGSGATCFVIIKLRDEHLLAIFVFTRGTGF